MPYTSFKLMEGRGKHWIVAKYWELDKRNKYQTWLSNCFSWFYSFSEKSLTKKWLVGRNSLLQLPGHSASSRGLRTDTQGRNWRRKSPWGTLLTLGLLSMACSTCFLIQLIPPTQSGIIHSGLPPRNPSLIRKMPQRHAQANLLEAIPHLRWLFPQVMLACIKLTETNPRPPIS